MKNFNKVLKEDFNFILSSGLPWYLLKDKTILISGANGFIASYLIIFLSTINSILSLNIIVVGIVIDINKAKKQFINIDSEFLKLDTLNIL